MMRFYDVFGETLPSMALARAAALAARGWAGLAGARGGRAGRRPARAAVLPYVPALLESHRQAGRILVLATTTPYDLVEPPGPPVGDSTK